MQSTQETTATTGSGRQLVYVKWNSPNEELAGTAQLANALVERHVAHADEICIAVPNKNWERQLRAVCTKLGIGITGRTPVRLSARAQSILATLDVLADEPQAIDAWHAMNGTDEQAQQLKDAYSQMRGHSLVRALKIDKSVELADALRHVIGDENAAQLATLLRQQTAHPTVPVGAELISVESYLAVSGTYRYLYLVGCVEGLIPGTQGKDLDAARAAYTALVQAERTRTIVSGFTKADAELADAAGLGYLRTKSERGRKLAMITPSRFLTEAGAQRPTTEGGQSLLKKYRLI